MPRSISSILAIMALGAAFAGAQQLEHMRRADGADTPLRVFAPSNAGCVPVAIISPGAGGTAYGYTYLAEGMQADGWLAIVVGHKESGPQKLRSETRQSGLVSGLEDMVTDPALYRDRMMDLGAALNFAAAKCKAPYVALIGHSMGAITAEIEAGARNKLGVKGEDRFDAYVTLSPSGPGPDFPQDAWTGIHKPLYLLTGTRDHALEGSWETRTRPFASLPPGCKWLGVIAGATHMDFAREALMGESGKLTVQTVTAFLDGARAGNCARPPVPSGMTLKTK